MNAPICLAKGADAVALRIRAVAEEARIPIVENPPLARALHATVELDQEIPPEHYRGHQLRHAPERRGALVRGGPPRYAKARLL